MLKTLTKKNNQRVIIVYYVLSIIFFLIGIYLGNSTWYVVGAVLLGMALFRKYFLMKRLKG